MVSSWGSFSAFVTVFQNQANALFGQGWVWLCVDAVNTLQVQTTQDQLNPLMHVSITDVCVPILGIDLWEHAYYLTYGTNRASYISDFWKIVDWAMVGNFYDLYGTQGIPVPL